MIYFTEISRDITGQQDAAETIVFQFYMKELPESIKFPLITKVNHIEYNGGFHTNQIMGVFPKEIEWEGCFYGTYSSLEKGVYSAKERSDEIKQFMGRPIRVGFAVPNGNDSYIPGESDESNSVIGKTTDKLKANAIVGVYVIEEYDQEIINYSDVNYRIKLTPHQRQEKIKPADTVTVAIKYNIETVGKAAANIGKIAGGKHPSIKKAKVAGKKSGAIAEQQGPTDEPLSKRGLDIEQRAAAQRREDAEAARRRLAAEEAKRKAKALPTGQNGKTKPVKPK